MCYFFPNFNPCILRLDNHFWDTVLKWITCKVNRRSGGVEPCSRGRQELLELDLIRDVSSPLDS